MKIYIVVSYNLEPLPDGVELIGTYINEEHAETARIDYERETGLPCDVWKSEVIE